MKKTIYICDSCKAEIEGNVTNIFDYDLCESCASKAKRIVTQFVTTANKIDWNGAQALRDAGWTLEDIAKEIGSTVSSVQRNTSKPKKRKQYEHESPESVPAILKSPELV